MLPAHGREINFMCELRFLYVGTVRILSESGPKKKKKKITPWRCTPTNPSHQGHIVETQQSSAVIENELGWQCSQSGKSYRLGASDRVKKRQITKISEPWSSWETKAGHVIAIRGNIVGCNNWLDIGCSSQCLWDTPVTDSTFTAELD